MLAINFQPILSKNNFQTKPRVLFCGFVSNPKNSGDCFVKSSIENIDIEEQKELLTHKILNNKTFINNPKLKEEATKIINYSKTTEQLELAELVLNNDFFYKEEKMSKIKGIICASIDNKKSLFVKKVLSNENVYKNDNVLNKLETVLYSMDNSVNSCEAKIKVLDKVLTSKKLYENKDFMDSFGSILYNTSDSIQAYKNINVLNSILNNEELSNNKDFIAMAGKVLANNKIFEIPQKNNVQTSLLKTIKVLNSPESVNVFSSVLKNKKLSSDNEFMQFLPDIITNIKYTNLDKTTTIINYINKNKDKNSKNFNKEIIAEYMTDDFKTITNAEQFVRVKFKAFDKKSQLQSANNLLFNDDIDTLFNNNKKYILPALEILGEKNFVHAYKLKSQGLKELCECCYLIKQSISDDYYEKLLEKINPKASQKYINKQIKIVYLKGKYTETKNSGDKLALRSLQNEINTYSKQSQDIIENKLQYDPETAINKIMVVSNVITTIKDKALAQQECHKFIDLMQNSTPSNDEKWQKAVCKSIFEKLGMEYNPKLIQKLDLVNNKYLGKILSADEECLNGIKDIFNQIKRYPNNSIEYALNQLENNKKTKILFNNAGIDYDKFVKYDKNSYITVGNGDICVKKVDMNNIGKSLFLGNEVGCCTAVGSRKQQASAPTYVLNKFVSAIEVVDSGVPVGNTMCYFANVEGKLSFVMDNIHVHSEYKNDKDVRDGIIQYVKIICEEVGKADIPIYVSGHRNSIDLSEFDSENYLISIIGDSGEDKIYLDSISKCEKTNLEKHYNSELIKVA